MERIDAMNKYTILLTTDKFKKNANVSILLLALSVGGCATKIEPEYLTSTKMSDTIWLTPVAQSKKTIFVDVKNTSEIDSLDLSQDIKSNLVKKKYTLVDNPDLAQYILQANVISIEKELNGSYQKVDGMGKVLAGTLIGGAVGGGIGYAGNHNAGNAALIGAGVGLIGGLIAAAIEADQENLGHFKINADILISEKSKNIVVESSSDELFKRGIGYKQGSQGSVAVNFNEQTDRKKYQTSVSTSTNASMPISEAIPLLKANLTKSIAGLF